MLLMFVVVFWFSCSSWLPFLILAYLINLMHHSLLHWDICFEGYLFIHTPTFLENQLNFWVFLPVPRSVDNDAKIVDERGRNFMFDSTLPILLVIIYISNLIYFLNYNILRFGFLYIGTLSSLSIIFAEFLHVHFDWITWQT